MRRTTQFVAVLAGITLLWQTIAVAQTQPSSSPPRTDRVRESKDSEPQTRWSPAQNRTWRWFERETQVNGKWRLSGITTPIHRETGERYTGAKGYLADAEVPADVRKRGHAKFDAEAAADIDQTVYLEDKPLENDPNESNEPGEIDPIRKAREGRPASKWLRGLDTAELKKWLPTIDPPEAGVEGMTFHEHLTRDHGFDGAKIRDLSEEEQAKLHAAAHAGY